MTNLTARELRHKALLAKIDRMKAARAAGIKALVRAETELPVLERKAARLAAPPKPRKPKPVEPPPAPPKPTRKAREKTGRKVGEDREKPKAMARVAEVDPTTQLGFLGPAPGFNSRGERVPDEDEPPKAGSHAKALEDYLNAPAQHPMVKKTYAERMEAAGFRRTSKR
jgi:hypothetical protein